MNYSLPNNYILGIVFKRLRMEEGVQGGRLFPHINPSIIYAILLNAKYKQEVDGSLTNLEEELSKEAGSYVKTYVADKWEQVKSENGKVLPFPEYASKTISEVLATAR